MTTTMIPAYTNLLHGVIHRVERFQQLVLHLPSTSAMIKNASHPSQNNNSSSSNSCSTGSTADRSADKNKSCSSHTHKHCANPKQQPCDRTTKEVIMEETQPPNLHADPTAVLTRKALPSFDREELVLGDLIGKGSFCHVRELRGIVLLHHDDKNEDSNDPCGNRESDGDNERHQLQRLLLQSSSSPSPQAASASAATAATTTTTGPQESTLVERLKDGTKEYHCQYVVKQLRPNLAKQRGPKVYHHAALDLRQEIAMLSHLHHPHIVEIKGACNVQGSIVCNSGQIGDGEDCTHSSTRIPNDPYFILLERLEGTLTQTIQLWSRLDQDQRQQQPQTQPPTTSQALYRLKLRYANEVADALAYLHERRLVFRDLKPDNLGIAANGSIKLFDFGLCRSLPREKDREVDCYYRKGRREPMFRMSGVGTRRYMAPEMIVGHVYNQSADCYAWAMVFYEMLALQKPFASYNREVHRIVVCENHERPYLLAPGLNIPRDARQLLHQAWAQDPCDRLTMKEIRDDYLGPMMECAQRRALSPFERSVATIAEMSELLGIAGTHDDANDCKEASSSFPAIRQPPSFSSWLPWGSLCDVYNKEEAESLAVSTGMTLASGSSSASSLAASPGGGHRHRGSHCNKNNNNGHLNNHQIIESSVLASGAGMSC